MMTLQQRIARELAMIALILSACLTNDPNVCRDYKIPIDADVDANTCMAHAQPQFAQWSATHPGWTVKRWHCGPTSEDKI